MGKTENTLLRDSVHEKNKSTSRLYSVSQKKKTHTHTSCFDSIHEKKQKVLHVFIVYRRTTKNTSRFDNVHVENKKYFLF